MNYFDKSKFLSLNLKDFLKGISVAVAGAVLGFLVPMFNAGTFVFDWTSVWQLAVGSAASYILKNLFTNSEDQILAREPIEE